MPTPAEADDALYFALLQVCDRSFFTFVESCEPARFAMLVKNASSKAAFEDVTHDEAVPQQLDWLKASVAFDGSFSKGEMEIFLPARLARWLVASMLGISRELELGETQLLDDQTFDGIGEFANIICGSWLTELGRNQAFDVGTPAVTRVPAGWNALADVNNKERRHLVCINELPMRILVRSAATD
jgi:chemotaxis phosphatase CheX-like protein